MTPVTHPRLIRVVRNASFRDSFGKQPGTAVALNAGVRWPPGRWARRSGIPPEQLSASNDLPQKAQGASQDLPVLPYGAFLALIAGDAKKYVALDRHVSTFHRQRADPRRIRRRLRR